VTKAKLIGVAAATCLALAACGGSSSSSSSTASLSTFKTGFSTDQTQFRAYGTQLGKDITGAGSKTDDELATELSALATRAKQQASHIAQLNPPAKYKQQVDDMVAAFGAVSTDLTNISSAAAKHDAKGAEAATKTLVTDAAMSKALGLKVPAS
jgi:hypothetical protein